MLLQDDDSLIREKTASLVSQLFFPHYLDEFCESYCLEKILRMLFGTQELHKHYTEELAKLHKRIELNCGNSMFEIEPHNIHREFHT